MLAGKNFSRRSFVGPAVFQCLMGISQNDYQNVFQVWIKRLKPCINLDGNFFEGMKESNS